MVTVTFYVLILLGSTFFVWLSEKCRWSVDRVIFLFVAFLIVFIPSAVRYDVGTDYLSYIAIYENEEGLNKYELTEPAFYFLNRLLRALEVRPQWLIATCAFVYTAVVFFAYPRRGAWLLHFLFFSILWYFSFNGVRQAIALSFCFYGMLCYLEKKYLKFFLLVIVGSLFHNSAAFYGLLGVAALIPLNPWVKGRLAPFVFVALILLTFVFPGIIMRCLEALLSYLGFYSYAAYFNNDKHFLIRDFGSGVGVLLKITFSIFLILSTRKLVSRDSSLWILVLLAFLYSVSAILAKDVVIFGRMMDTFSLALVFGTYYLFYVSGYNSFGRYVSILFLIFLFLSFIKDGLGEPNSYGDPRLNPYKSIFHGA